MEEEGGEGVSSAGIDDHAAKPPAQTGRPHKQAVDGRHRDREGVVPNGARMCSRGGRWRNEV